MEILRINYETVAKELNMTKLEVETYFHYYHLYKMHPIRDLTHKEIQFAKLSRILKSTPEYLVLEELKKYDLTYSDFRTNPATLLQRQVDMTNAEIKVVEKYYKYLIEPYVKNNLDKAPVLKPLTKDDLIIIITNIAAGISSNADEVISAKTKLDAAIKLFDIYYEGKYVPLGEREEVEMVDYDELSPQETKQILGMIQHMRDKNMNRETLAVKSVNDEITDIAADIGDPNDTRPEDIRRNKRRKKERQKLEEQNKL